MTSHGPQNRQPAGVPVGGQYAATERTEPSVALDTQPEEPYHSWFHHTPCGGRSAHDGHYWGERPNQEWCIGEPPPSA